MASKSPDEVADEDIIEEPDVSEQPDIPAVDDNRGIEQQGPLAALSAASGSSSAVAMSIELPAVNQLDEKIKPLQKDREALKTQRKQVARELKAKKEAGGEESASHAPHLRRCVDGRSSSSPSEAAGGFGWSC